MQEEAMRLVEILITLALLAPAAAVPAAAQTRSPGWPPALQPGRSVWLVLDDGHDVEVKGTVVDVSSTSVQLRQGNELRTFLADDIIRIDVRDALGNGAVIGAAAGAAALGIGYAVLAATICPDCNQGQRGREIVNSLEWAALGGALGAVAGVSIDAVVGQRRVLYVAPMLALSPSRTSPRVGVVVRVAW
jgi:hypothetical protein